MLASKLVDIYLAAMEYDPAIHEQRLRAWRFDMLRPGFTCIIAVTQNEIVGVAYGFIGSLDTWWDKQVRGGISRVYGRDYANDLLRDYFELAEIHVSPGYQGQGVGRSLIKELLWNIPASRVILSTPEVPAESNAAFGLYRSLGFYDVLRDFRFPGDSRHFAVLARPLPLS